MATATRQTKAQLQEALWQHQETIGLLEERFAELELAIEDSGWIRISQQNNREFSRDGLRKITLMSVMAYLKNPLIRHATEVQAHYVWGQGVNIHCPDDGINKVVQAFLKDRKNQRALTGHQARIEREEELQTKSNLFIVLFTDKSKGRVSVRTIPFEEIEDIIRNPDDAAEPWYYVRKYTRLEFNTATGKIEEKQNVIEYYPDWLYSPDVKPSTFDGKKVMWDSPVYHVAVNRLGDMRFGVPEHYSALDWAMAVKNDLEDYATIRRALARFAWRLTVGTGPKAVSAAKQKLGTTLGANGTSNVDRNPPAATGSTWIQQQGGAVLEPLKTAGAAPNPEEGRRLWLMVSSGTGIPETILTGDSSVGNYATSRTLDRPTELKMRTRQELWAGVYKDILTYVIAQSRGSITGELTSLPQVVERAVREAQSIVSGTAVMNLGGPQDSNVDLEESDLEINIDFPAILEHDILQRVQAIVQASTLNGQQTAGTMSDRTLIRLLLRALNVDNADALLDEILPGGADYFDTEKAKPQPDPSLLIAAQAAQNPPEPTSIKEAVPAPKPPKPGDPAAKPVKVGDGEDNPNVDEHGIGTDKSGLHKVAPPPPSMRNDSQPSPNAPNPFDPFNNGGGNPQMDTGKNPMRGGGAESQRVKGTGPRRTPGNRMAQ